MEDGKVDPAKMKCVDFRPIPVRLLCSRGKVGQAWQAGREWMK